MKSKTLVPYALCTIAMTGCMGMNNSSTTSLSSMTSPSGGGTNPSTAPVAVSVIKKQLNLGTSAMIPVTIQSLNGYSGMVNLSLDTKVLTANDPMSMVTTSISPASVSVSPGSPATANVTVVAAAGAPDMDQFVNVIANAGSQEVTAAAPFQILAVYEVDLDGPPGADETWSLAGGSTTKFTQHLGGITINFKNKDTTTPSAANSAHRIHSSGTAFLHEGDGLTGKGEGMGLPGSTTPVTIDNPATSTQPATTAGDTYTVVVNSQASQLSDTFYCHQHENATTAARTMVFNAYSAPPVIGNSGNPNASFAYLQANLITPMCAKCHVAQSSGGVSLASYTSVLNIVQAGSAAGSSFYTSVAPGGNMPQNGPAVSAALVQDLKDWIDDGAKNN